MPLQLTEYQVHQTYPTLLAATQDIRSRKGCHNCRFNNPKLCNYVAVQDSTIFHPMINDCHDWQGKN
jgi:hypothetical protein